MHTRHLLALVSPFALLTSCTFVMMPPRVTDKDQAAFRALDESFCKLALAGDFKTLVELFYTEDPLFMAPNAPAARGRAQIEAALRALPPLTAFTLQSDDMDGDYLIAYSRGRYSMTMAPPGAPPIHDTGKFVVIYRKQDDGSWKVSRDIFNSDLPLKP